MNLLESFQKYIADNGLATTDDRILLTVSGGVDSMVMLSLFTRSGFRTGVAHCNFQLRGAESDEDEVLVAQKAAELGVPCYNRRFDTVGEMERTGESMEMAARRLRYAWFEELCRTVTMSSPSPTMPMIPSRLFSSTFCEVPVCAD